MNRTDTSYDAVLNLLDRQIVDADGRLVAKVDDVELAWTSAGLVPTGLLCGMTALLPRLGGRLGNRLGDLLVELRWASSERGRPFVIEFDHVEELTSEVRLSVSGEALLSRIGADRADDPDRVRLSEVVGMPVRCDRLSRRARVVDLHVSGRPGREGSQRVAALVVGPDRPGGFLGYDRSEEAGPALVAAIVRWLHRNARVVDLGPGVAIDNEQGEVRIGPGVELRSRER